MKSLLKRIQNQRRILTLSILTLLVLILCTCYSIVQQPLVQMELRKLVSVTYVPVNNTLPLTLLWSYSSSESIKVPPVGNSQAVFLLLEPSLLTGLRNETGEVAWEHNTGARIRTVTAPEGEAFDLNEELLVISVDNERLLALETATGNILWQAALSSKTHSTPAIELVGNLVIASAWANTTEGYVSAYQASDGTFAWDLYWPPRTHQYTFSCPFIPLEQDTSAETICFALHEVFQVVDPIAQPVGPSRILLSRAVSLISRDAPYYRNGLIFTNPYATPANHVYDVIQDREFTLPANCSGSLIARAVTAYGDQILVANGCDELYILDINHLDARPMWIHQSPNRLLSSFVTLDGEIGYVLTEKAEILAIDLSNGSLFGKFETEPTHLDQGQFNNALVTNPPYLYALLNRKTLFVFKQTTLLDPVRN